MMNKHKQQEYALGCKSLAELKIKTDRLKDFIQREELELQDYFRSLAKEYGSLPAYHKAMARKFQNG